MTSEQDAINWLSTHRRNYADRWSSENAPNLAAQDAYSWMADFIAGHNHVLDIGCGDGSGILELASRGHSVISIEENPYCIAKAKSKCESRNVPVTTCLRGEFSLLDNKLQVSFRPISQASLPSPGLVLILEGDLLNDDQLLEWLMSSPKFEAVTCWCIGTDKTRVETENHAGAYRLRMENATYTLADAVLAPEGTLHFIHRGISRGKQYDEEDATDEIRAHREMAEITSLIVDADSLTFRPFLPSTSNSAITLTKTLGTSGSEALSHASSHLTSIQARMPRDEVIEP